MAQPKMMSAHTPASRQPTWQEALGEYMRSRPYGPQITDLISMLAPPAPEPSPQGGGPSGLPSSGPELMDLLEWGVSQPGMSPMAPILYHGTPHRFPPTPKNPLGEFDMSKIGTGEGWQAYGHGMYLAENRRVAEDYARKLARGIETDPKTLAEYFKSGNIVPSYAGTDRVLKWNPETMSVVVQRVKRSGDSWVPAPGERPREHATFPTREQVAQVLGRGPGQTYRVNLPDEVVPRLLDWDAPLAQQPEAVSSVLRSLGVEPLSPAPGWGRIHEFYSGQDAYRKLAEISPYNKSDRLASTVLGERGIPGLRYFDQGSRNVRHDWMVTSPSGYTTVHPNKQSADALVRGQPGFRVTPPAPASRNYVIWQPDLLDILGIE